MNIGNLLDDFEKEIGKAIRNDKIEDAMGLIAYISKIRYVYNSTFTDLILEDYVTEIIRKLRLKEYQKGLETDNNTVLFYDGFGLNTRGIALQYIQGLVDNKYKVIYITYKKYKERIKNIEEILSKHHNASILFLQSDSFADRAIELCKVIDEEKAKSIVYYSKPNDIVGVVSFQSFEGVCNRFLINLTDHAYWLGTNSCDVFIEFRDFGGLVSSKYRGIPETKLIKLPYYPLDYFDKNFQGFPFEKKEDNVVVFSGGALYKTFDDDNTYYNLIDKCLIKHKKVLFWYAGSGDATRINQLAAKHPGRVFHTKERSDLIEVLKNIDIYINTYPQTGGLMMQFCVSAAKNPLTLKSKYSGRGELLNEDKGHLFETEDEMLLTIDKMIESPAYRREINQKQVGNIISRTVFNNNLKRIIENQSTEFPLRSVDDDINSIIELYNNRFNENDIYLSVEKEVMRSIIRTKPLFGVRCILKKAMTRIHR